MALYKAQFDGGTTPASIKSLFSSGSPNFSGISGNLRELRIKADAANTGDIFLGPSTVTSVPANETERLDAGEEFKIGPHDGQRPYFVDLDSLYIVGSAAAQLAYVTLVTDDGTR